MDQRQASTKQSRIVLVVVLAIAALAIAGIIAMLVNTNSNAPATTQNDATGSTPSTDSDMTSGNSEMATLTFTDSGFSPTTLTVKRGTRVNVINESSNPVQFSSDDHPTHRENPEMNMEQVAPGETGTVTVNEVGTHRYHDHIDESKTGTLIVTE